MDREALGKWSCISRVEDRVDREAIGGDRIYIFTRSEPDPLDLYLSYVRSQHDLTLTSIRFDIQID
ncbi:hypothetical protein DPMN_008039 [Dreissena polymorpha]|uniref:Uncharacterized protein n=1 Tax=Dreissena polymorpha TaxID=45954 RepID=A0A9D4MZL4_DREPO|nr:hypothetical protein DPMN_008039 [Dreissena polymorpha]